MAIASELHPIHPGLAQEQDAIINPELLSCDYKVQPSVCAEIAELAAEGVNVALIDPEDPHGLSAGEQAYADSVINELEGASNGADLFRVPPAMNAWAPLTKKAIALRPLYDASTIGMLGEGIAPDAYDVPLFPATDPESPVIHYVSAKDILYGQEEENRAEAIDTQYAEFLKTSVDDATRLIFQGSADGAAIRTRAYTAVAMAKAQLTETGGLYGRNLRSASLACGAANPVYGLVNDLGAEGAEFDKITLVDQDAMALASAHSLAEGAGVQDKIDLQLRDLLSFLKPGGESLTDYIEPQSVDVVDLLGLFEYIMDSESRPWATKLLQQVKEIVKPGGLIVFGNMLDDRPQQRFFNDVVKWPRLKQRTIRQTLGIIEKAGFDSDDVEIRVPAREGVYAVYAIKIPPASNAVEFSTDPELPLAA